MATTITLALGGCVNGAPVDLRGRAVLDGSSLEQDLTASATPLHWDPVLGLLGLLDAVRLVALLGSLAGQALDTVHLRSRAGLSDDQGRDVGHEALSLVLRAREGGGLTCRGQYLSARTRLEPVERATDLVAACATLAMPIGEGSLLLAGAARFETDWGNRYRVAGHAVAAVYGVELPEGVVEVGLVDGELVRTVDESGVERMRFECTVELQRLRPGA